MMSLRPLALTLAALALVACGGAEQRGPVFGGTLVVASASDADALLPPLITSTAGKEVADQLFAPLALISDDLQTIGDKGFTPYLAERWEWSPDSLSVAFTIHPKARWHDGRAITAGDVKYTFDLIREPAVRSFVASQLSGVDSVTVRDSSVAVAWFKRRYPEQFYQFVTNVIPIPAHVYGATKPEELAASPAARAPVGSARFRFVRWEPEAAIELIADTAHWKGRPKLDRLIFRTLADPSAATASVLTGESDFIEVIRGDAAKQLATATDVRPVSRPVLDLTAMFFRTQDGSATVKPHPILGDREVRRAIGMSIDRVALARNLLDTLGAAGIGPVPRGLVGDDTLGTSLPYDVDAARKAFDGAGWRDGNGDGVREKGGKPLQFSLAVPASSVARLNAATIIQEQLKQVGVKVDIASMEPNTFGKSLMSGQFDAALIGFGVDPSQSGMVQNWGSEAARTGNGFNVTNYRSPAFDATYDSAASSFDPARAKALYHRARAIVVEDAPAIFLFEPFGRSIVHKRVRPATMRADAWWAHLDEWTIDLAQALPRDKIGLRPTQK